MKHRERMDWTASHFMPPKGTPAYDELVKQTEKNRNDPTFQKAVKDRWDAARSTTIAQQENGLGHESDVVLRQFTLEACNRLWNLGPWGSMPASFNVISDFVEYLPTLNLFRVRDEQDHEFSVLQFLDFVTSPGQRANPFEKASQIENGKVLHFTNMDALDSMYFGESASKQFVFAGCAMVRHDSELSLCLIAGAPNEGAEDWRAACRDVKWTPGKEQLGQLHTHSAEVLALRGDLKWQQIVALMRVDLEAGTQQVRYLLEDFGDNYRLFSDDPSIWIGSDGEPHTPTWESTLQQNIVDIGRFSPVFEFLHHCISLPDYFNHHADDIVVRRCKTNYGVQLSSLKFSKMVAAALPDTKIAYRIANYLTFQGPRNSPSSMVLPELNLRIETTGYWKNLAPNQMGCDRNDKPVKGRTWVRKELAWREASPGSAPLYANDSVDVSAGANPGYIYVMRSAAHPIDVFKVGLTRRDVRARAEELSASTSSPDKFLVVQQWITGDCVRAEALIHESLGSFRLNTAREYFRADYSFIRSHIEEALSQVTKEIKETSGGEEAR